MASNAQKIIARYGDGAREEGRSLSGRAEYSMEYKYTKRLLDRYVDQESTVLEIGCGTGYYGIYLADKCKSYMGLDIAPGNIAVFDQKIRGRQLLNVQAMVADATDLSGLASESYDIVLVLGPMYHLPAAERELVFMQSKRICRKGGILFFAYINKVGVYLGQCLNHPEQYPNKQKNDSILVRGIDDTRDHIYWFTMPEEMEEAAKGFGLSVLDNLGVDFMFLPGMFTAPPERRGPWEEMSDFLCQSRSCTGFANHAVMVCKK